MGSSVRFLHARRVHIPVTSFSVPFVPFFFFFAANSPQMTTNYAALDSYRNRWFAAANEINKTRPRERGGGGGGGEGKRSQE